MFLSQMTLKNFRKYTELTINFHKGLNALVGENDSGKSTIIDAIKIVLSTQSDDYIAITEDDFFTDSDGKSATEFSIQCIIENFEVEELKNFIEFTTVEKEENNSPANFKLFLFFRANKEGNRIYRELSVGGEDRGEPLNSKAKELLKCVYLKPLRDAEREMCRGRNSRISQILYNHPHFYDKESNELVEIIKKANEDIQQYFVAKEGKVILANIRETLQEFIDNNASNSASIETSRTTLKQILESLSLIAPERNPGLGVYNLLFIAAELLLLNSNANDSLKLALIEELEAHLHPQAQLRLMNYLQKKYNDSGVQLIISTHSPTLASKINTKNIILIKGNAAYELTPDKTALNKGDYLFLQRFLDATKANFFFAKGIIMVEGDAEALLIPTLADILGLNLEKHGVSLVNVGNIAFFRYSKIFLRSQGDTLPIPVSIITDCDIKPEEKNGVFNTYNTETERKIESIKKKYNKKNVQVFVAPRWTLEYSIGLSSLKDMLFESILQAEKIKNSDKYALTDSKIKSVHTEFQKEQTAWKSISPEKVAYKYYHDIMLEKQISKAIVAQCLASNLRWSLIDETKELTKEKMFDLDLYQISINEDKRKALAEQLESDIYLKYIVDAIKHAAGVK